MLTGAHDGSEMMWSLFASRAEVVLDEIEIVSRDGELAVMSLTCSIDSGWPQACGDHP